MRVGPYDDQVMPAVILFHDEESNCSYAASRLFYNPEVKSPGEYDQRDFRSSNYRLNTEVDSVKLRPGYKVYLYEQPKWQGNYEVIEGAYEEVSNEGRLKC